MTTLLCYSTFSLTWKDS